MLEYFADSDRLLPVQRMLRHGILCLAALLLTLGPVCAEEPDLQPTACFDSIWNGAHAHPWYLDAEGREIIPQIARDWLIVKFSEAEASPQNIKFFSDRYPEAFDGLNVTVDPAGRTASYRLRQGLPYGLYEALLQRWREDPQVHSIQPAWKIDNQLYAPLDQIEVEWKTTADPQTRQRLLTAVQSLEQTARGPDTVIVTIDPCQRLAWQAAVLLAEDLYVARATPLKTPLEPPVTVQLQFDRPGGMTGMPMPFHLEIRFAEGITIETATIANLNLGPSGIFHNLYEIRFDQPLSAIDLSRSPIQISGTLQLYATGDYQLPALPVYYTDHRTGEARPETIRTRNLPIRIAAMVPETAQEHRLQIAEPAALPTVSVPGRARYLQRSVALLVAGLLLLALGMTAWLRHPSRRSDQKQIAARARQQKLHDDLAARIERDPCTMQPGDWAELGGALQDLLTDYAGLPAAPRGGSYSSFLPRLKSHLTTSETQQAEGVLRGIEHLLAADGLDIEQRRALLTQAGTLLASLTSRETGQAEKRGAH